MINTSNRNHVSISRIKEVQLEHESFFLFVLEYFENL